MPIFSIYPSFGAGSDLIVGSGTAGQVTYWVGTEEVSGNSGFLFDTTNNVTVPAGSAAHPGINFVGGTTTGLYFGSSTLSVGVSAAQVAGFDQYGLGILSGVGSTNANVVLMARKDQNTSTQLQLENAHVGSSATALLKFTTNAGDSTITAGSTASGAAFQVTSGTSFTGGLQLEAVGSNPVLVKSASASIGRFEANGLAILDGIGNLSSSTAFIVAKGQNGITVAQVANANAGASAQARFYITSNVGNVSLTATSTAGGATAIFSADSGFSGGMDVSIGGVNPLRLNTNSLTRLSISGAGVVNISDLTASQAVVTDGSKNLASLAYASANTVSALVQRDSSGNFAAGTITASLTGTATDCSFTTNATLATLSKSTGVAVHGTNTNDAASAGYVGEYVESLITSATNFPTTAEYGDATSISLTAGDWDVTACVEASINGATSVTAPLLGISVTTGNSATGLTSGVNLFSFPAPASTGNRSGFVPNYRVSLAGTTTHYLKIIMGYTGGPPQFTCRLSARRVR